jgi:hypothetical protein
MTRARSLQRRLDRNREAELKDLLHVQQLQAEAAAWLELLEIRAEKALRHMASAEAPDVYRHQGAYNELVGLIDAVKAGKTIKLGGDVNGDR